jgi:hypothetical protein
VWRLRLYRWLGWSELPDDPAALPVDKPILRSLRDAVRGSGVLWSAWGFGLTVALVSLSLRWLEGDTVCEVNAATCWMKHGSMALAALASGAGTFAFLRWRGGGAFVQAALLIGLTYILVFPLYAFVFSLWYALGDALTGRFGQAFEHLAGIPWRLVGSLGGRHAAFLVCVLVSVVLFLLAARRSNVRLWAASDRDVRWMNGMLGTGLMLYGAVLAVGRYFQIRGQIALLKSGADQWGHPQWLQDAARLQADLWNIVAWSSVPILVVGVLLFLPPRKGFDSHRQSE